MGSGVVVRLMAGLVVVCLVGCGDGEPDPLTKAEFLQGNEACLRATEDRDAAMKEAVKSAQPSEATSGEAEFEEFVTDVLLPPVQEMADELDGLGVPKGDAKQIEAIVNAFQNEIDELEADPADAGADSFTAASRRAEPYGLTDCPT